MKDVANGAALSSGIGQALAASKMIARFLTAAVLETSREFNWEVCYV
jgi:hypothetical protein